MRITKTLQPGIKFYFSSHKYDVQYSSCILQKTDSGAVFLRVNYLSWILTWVCVQQGISVTYMEKTRWYYKASSACGSFCVLSVVLPNIFLKWLIFWWACPWCDILLGQKAVGNDNTVNHYHNFTMSLQISSMETNGLLISVGGLYCSVCWLSFCGMYST